MLEELILFLHTVYNIYMNRAWKSVYRRTHRRAFKSDIKQNPKYTRLFTLFIINLIFLSACAVLLPNKRT